MTRDYLDRLWGSSNLALQNIRYKTVRQRLGTPHTLSGAWAQRARRVFSARRSGYRTSRFYVHLVTPLPQKRA